MVNIINVAIVIGISLLVGFLASFTELYIGHTYILNPLLLCESQTTAQAMANTAYYPNIPMTATKQGCDENFRYETYFAPTWYGFIKFYAVAFSFYIIVLLMQYTPLQNLGLYNSLIIGALGTGLFGLYYYLIYPLVSVSSIIIIGIVHFAFISAWSFVGLLLIMAIL